MTITDSLKRRAHVVHYKKDIIPTILMDLLAARKGAKKTRDKFAKGSFKYNINERCSANQALHHMWLEN